MEAAMSVRVIKGVEVQHLIITMNNLVGQRCGDLQVPIHQ